MRVLYVFRNDLRVSDNQVIDWLQTNDVNFTFAFFTPISYKSYGTYRKKFLAETLLDLDSKLKEQGSALQTINQPLESVLEELCIENKIEMIVMTQEFSYYETQQEKFVVALVNKLQIRYKFFEGITLLSLHSLPISIEKFPIVFTEFRKKVEPLGEIATIKNKPLDSKKYFSLKTKYSSIAFTTQITASLFLGGETMAEKRVHEFLWETNAIQTYKETRNGMIEFNDSSKFSPWLANGSLSPRFVYQQIKEYEADVVSNDSTYWLIFELLWRDYFKFLSLRFGNKLFLLSGTRNKIPSLCSKEEQEKRFAEWCNGETNSEFINANMRELKSTGWMSNRGRQNVASYLAKILQVDWRKGAQWFEQHLVDYDAASNWGNWQYLAGVGTDPRDRTFNVESQVKAYDPNGEYQRLWAK